MKRTGSKLGHHASDPHVHAPLFRVRHLKAHLVKKLQCRSSPNSTWCSKHKVFGEKTTDGPKMKISTHFLGVEMSLNKKRYLKDMVVCGSRPWVHRAFKKYQYPPAKDRWGGAYMV